MGHSEGKWKVELNGVAGNPDEFVLVALPNPKDLHLIKTIGKTFAGHGRGLANALHIVHCVNNFDMIQAENKELKEQIKVLELAADLTVYTKEQLAENQQLQAELEKAKIALHKIRFRCVYTARKDMAKEYERAWREQTNIADQALTDTPGVKED